MRVEEAEQIARAGGEPAVQLVLSASRNLRMTCPGVCRILFIVIVLARP